MAWRKSWSAPNLDPRGTKRRLTPEQRSVWDDVLDLAELSPITGVLCVVEGVQYTSAQMAAIFKTPLAVVQVALRRFRHLGMLGADGQVVHWTKYQSEYQRQKGYRQQLQTKVTTQSARKSAPPEYRVQSTESEEHPFDRFWSLYPRKVNKEAARKAWRRLAPDAALEQTMAQAIADQRRWPQWVKDGGQFIPHPATWLNGRRWEDQGPTEAAMVAGGARPRSVAEALSPEQRARLKALTDTVGRTA